MYVVAVHVTYVHVHTLGFQPRRKFEEDNKVLKRQILKPIHFINPASGPRLGMFEPSDSNVEEMPCGSPNLTEVRFYPARGIMAA